MKIKIALAGKMSTGKDTAVDYIINKYSGTKISFAQPIYDILTYAQKVCGFKEEKDRKFLQIVGTEWGRQKETNVWVRLALEKALKQDGNVLISDVRFPNEFSAVKDDGWICIKLIRNCVGDERIGTGSVKHKSEVALDIIQDISWDYIIDNNGTLEEFYGKLDKIIDNKR
jgi:hypothetical protein